MTLSLPKKLLGGAAAVVALCVAACESPPTPDIDALYSRAAMADGPDRNPVILVPGILGSTLVDDSTDRIVWGGFVYGAADPQSAEGARLVALPYRDADGRPVYENDIRADGALDTVRVQLLGIPLSLEAYHGILQSLGLGGYRDSGMDRDPSAVDYGPGHYTCHQFGYDWRLSNAENAARLREYIDEIRESVRVRRKAEFGVDRPVEVDIVAHSMGGLVVRYMLRYGDQGMPENGPDPVLDWRGSEGVGRVILVATPSAGSVLSVRQILAGQDYGYPFLPAYSKEILGSFESIYELMPRDRHRPLEVKGGAEAMSIFDPETWRMYGWGLADPSMSEMTKLMPDATDDERRAAAWRTLVHNLEGAERFQRLLDSPAMRPAELDMHLIMGGGYDTPRRLEVNPKNGSVKVTDTVQGDQIVPRSSALMDEREDPTVEWSRRLQGPIRWSSVTPLAAEHLKLTETPVFTDNLLYLLLEDPR